MRKGSTGSPNREHDAARDVPGQRMSDPQRPADPVDEAAEQSFPASDPPAWIGMHAGAPTPYIDVPSPEDYRSGAPGAY
jgi:hypothetical protein